MDLSTFEAALTSEGFSDIVTVQRDADGFLDIHAHAFEAKALILDGEISLHVGTTTQRYQTGEIFHLTANQPHSERYGPAGVRYLVGRK